MKLLIIDDEQRIVEYLKHILDWKTLGFNQVVGLSSSSTAQDYLIKNEPDLMITDIRMPQISGLDLMEFINNNHLKTKVIILSGYNDFNYAQKAIRLGTVDYLLKPITSKDLLPAIERIITIIRKKNHQKLIEKENRSQFFIEGLSTLTKNPTFFYENSKETLSLEKTLLPGTIQLKLKNQYITISEGHENVTTTLSKDNLQVIFISIFNMTMDQYEFPDELQTLIEEEKWTKVLNVIESNKYNVSNQLLFQIDLLQIFSKKFPKLLTNIDLEKILENNEQDFFVVDFIKEFINVENEKSDVNQIAVDKIIDFIQLNYRDEITLDVLSNVVYMHPVTISRIFKATTGNTVSAFLSKVRMDAAAELLEHSNLLVSDIGNLVGYHKTQYFIKLFKQKYEVTPQKYRRKIRLESDSDV